MMIDASRTLGPVVGHAEVIVREPMYPLQCDRTWRVWTVTIDSNTMDFLIV